MALPLSGKVAVITGSSKGVGRGIALELAHHGATIVVNYNSDHAGALATLEAVNALGAPGIIVQANVGDATQITTMFNSVKDSLGRVDILVNNAGVGVFEPIGSMSLDAWHKVFDTNVTGVFHTCRAALPLLRARGGGWIINISSLASTTPFPNGGAYCASKVALNAFSESLMQEVRHDGIRVACVLPGSVRTGFMGHVQTAKDDWKLAPGDVADVVIGLVTHPPRSLPSRVEIRPAQPPKKG